MAARSHASLGTVECPVAMVDHESNLVAADWYEEQGEQVYADTLRLCNRLPMETIVRIRARVSRTHAKSANARRISQCKVGSNLMMFRSRCTSRHKFNAGVSTTKARKRSGWNTSGCKSSKGYRG